MVRGELHDVLRRAGRLCVRWLALVNDELVGSAYAHQPSWLPSDVIELYAAVHPDHQNRGYGRALLERAEATAAERGGNRASSWTDETQPRAMRFLERAGFSEVARGWESALDLTRCDTDQFQDAIDRAASTGIRIMSATTLASERDDWKQQPHRLYTDIERDVPAPFPIE